MSIEQDLASLKSKGERLHNLRIENKTKLEGLEAEKEKLLIEAQALGIDPTQIEIILAQEEIAIKAEVAKLNDELTRVLGEISVI
jgi:trehalose-6-phosphate synthase